jgi:hypothetical protein
MSRATPDEAADVVGRMQALRSTGDRDVRQLQHEIGRVSDWREYVRARPGLSALAAAVIGFVAVRAVFVKKTTPAPLAEAASGPSPTSSALGFVGGIVGSMARQMITEYVKKEFKAGQNGNATKSGERERTTSNY